MLHSGSNLFLAFFDPAGFITLVPTARREMSLADLVAVLHVRQLSASRYLACSRRRYPANGIENQKQTTWLFGPVRHG